MKISVSTRKTSDMDMVTSSSTSSTLDAEDLPGGHTDVSGGQSELPASSNYSTPLGKKVFFLIVMLIQ